MLKPVDTECIRHIHTDDKDSFYLGVISADVRVSEVVFRKDKMHALHL